jgi:hypothetical protein
MGPGGFRRLQNDCDLTMSGLVGSIPMHSRHQQLRLVRRLLSPNSARSAPVRRVVLLVALGCASLPGNRALAQRVDSAQVGAKRQPTDTTKNKLPKPPLSPRRAFLYSLAVPGYAQSVLNRPTAGALFVLTESIAIAMLRESKAELREARRFQTDSLLTVGFNPDGTEIKAVSAYTQQLVDVRRSHVEDWIAFLIANHLFAAADAYVGAHLWDLPTQISVESRPNGTVVAAKLRW